MRANPMTIFFAKCSWTSKKSPVVDNPVNDVTDIIRSLRLRRDNGIEFRILAVYRIVATRAWDFVAIVLRKVRQAVRGCCAGTPRHRAERKCATPLIALCVCAPPSSSLRDVLMSNGLDDIGTGHEHVAGAVDHEDEVGQGR